MRSAKLKTVLAGVLLMSFSMAPSDAKKPDKPGGGGGGGSDTPPPALVYVVNDAVITVASADGQTISKLTGGSKGWSIVRRSPTWSPDGSMIAYSEKPDKHDNPDIVDLYVMNSDGSSKTFVRRFHEYVDIERYTGFDWLPGGYLGFDGVTGADVIDLSDGTVESLNLDLLVDSVGSPSFGPGVDPTTPGSSGLVVFSGYTPGTTNWVDIHLAVLETDSNGALMVDPSSIRRLDLPGRQEFPVIAPNGQQVAFYTDAYQDGGDTLAMVNLDYSSGVDFGAVNVVAAGGFGEFRLRPTWTPDSEYVAFTWNHPNSPAYEIARMHRSGTEFTNVTISGAHETYPNWHPVPSDP
jgi:Tol biopolymer transport system component